MSSLPLQFLLLTMAGQPAEATKLLRAEFERTQKILALEPWPQLDDGPSGKGRFDGLAFQFDMAMSLAAVNPADSEVRKLAYEMALYARTRNSEVERRVSAALAELRTPEVLELRTRMLEARNAIASIELRRLNGAP